MTESNDLARLVLIATSSWRSRPSQEACERHDGFLAALLAPDGPGQASLCCLPPAQRRAKLRSASVSPTSSPDADADADDPRTWYADGPDADRARAHLVEDLRQVCFERLRSPEAATAGGLLGLRHRVHLTGDRLLAVLGRPDLDGLPPVQVGIDVRYRKFYSPLSMRLSLSVWSRRPRSEHHAPEWAPEITEGGGHDRRAYHDAFQRVRDAFEAWMRDEHGFRPETTRILGTRLAPPVFWIAIPGDAGSTSAAEWLDARRPSLENLGRPFLDTVDPRDRGTAASVIGNDLVAVRRLVPDEGARVPTYLLVPGRPDTSADAPGEDRFVAQEDRIRTVVRHLSDLETDVATRIWDAQSDLEIWENHLDTYQRVVDRGASLWDALAGHLLQHRRRRLGRVHRSIELIHQTLLQGVADADGVHTRVSATRSRMIEDAAELTDNYDALLADTTPAGATGILEAVLDQGPFGVASIRAREIASKAARVARNYRDLVQAISDAFEERRVRESEVLERATFPLALVVGLVGIVTVLDTTFSLQQPSNFTDGTAFSPLVGWPVQEFWLRLVVQLLGVVLLVGLFAGATILFRRGRLGSREYRRNYREVWEVLRFCSTDHLAAVARRLDPQEEALARDDVSGLKELDDHVAERRRRSADRWDAVDRQFAQAYAHAWDLVTSYQVRRFRTSRLPIGADITGDLRHLPDAQTPRLPGGRPWRWAVWWRAGRDLRQLGVMIEKWSLRTFLVTERPLQLWKAALPRLTILYRCALALADDDPDVPRIVSDMDFFFVFSRPGHDLTWEQTERLHALLDRAVHRLRPPRGTNGVAGQVSAVELLKELEGMPLGLGTAGLDVTALGEPAPVDAVVDPLAEPHRSDPYAYRPVSPVVYAPTIDRWIVTGYAEAEQVLRDVEAFALSETRRPLFPLAEGPARMLADGGEHVLYSRDGSADHPLRAHHERIMEKHGAVAREAMSDELGRAIGAVRMQGRADLVTDVLRLPPMVGLLSMIGVPPVEAATYVHLAASARRVHGNRLSAAESVEAVADRIELATRCKRAVGSAPRLSGCGTDAADVLLQMVISGPEATSALLGNAVHRLLAGQLWTELVRDPSGVAPAAVAESLRHGPSVVRWRREATRAVTIGGTGGRTAYTVPEGARILVDIAAANRDPALCPVDPEAFELRQERLPHLSFGTGPHACPAQDLVRCQAQDALVQLARSLPDLRLDPEHPVTPSTADLTIHGPEHLPVLWG